MSPPTPVISRKEVESKYSAQLKDPSKHQCSLWSLSQLECTFKISPETLHVVETICIPFKRVFQRCLLPQTRIVNNCKVTGKRWVNIEITLPDTSDEIKTSYNGELLEFLRADGELKKYIESMSEE